MLKRNEHTMVMAARERVRGAGLRATAARIRVLAEMSATGGLLSHHDLERALGASRIDRVTLYRVLESLVENGLAHRVSGDDRVWRFGATARAISGGAAGKTAGMVRETHERHAHFQCSDCGKITCLRETPAAGRAVRLPQGYRPETVELTVKGRCPGCVS